MESGYKSKVLRLIGIATIIRCIVATGIELGNDEVYYWTYSQHLQWNYFDHPPMVALWIRLFTVNLWLEGNELFVRLGSIISAAICTWLLYKTTSAIHSQKSGWYAACLYTASIYATIIAGVFIMPDSPQMLFWCLCLYLLAGIYRQPKSWSLWILFGFSTGLCLMSKVHAVFVPLGLVLFMVFQQRNWFLLPQVYVAALLAAAVASPILLWNISNDFITYRFHSERVSVDAFKINTSGFLREVFGQFAYNNPFNVVLTGAALLAWKRKALARNKIISIYLFIALPMIGILLFVALFRNTFPHWSGPAYVSLLPLTGIYLTTMKRPVLMPAQLRWALSTILFAIVAGLALIHFYPGTLGKKTRDRLGAGDFTLDLYGWQQAGEAFAKIYNQQKSAGIIEEGTPVVNYKWFPAAHQDYYFCRPLGIELIGIGSLLDLHHYSWSNRWRSPKALLAKAFCIVPSNLKDDVLVRYADYYRNMKLVATIEQRRSGVACRYFSVYRLEEWKGKAILLP